MTIQVQLEVEKQQIWITVYMCMEEKRRKNLYKFSGESKGGQNSKMLET